MGILNVTPDSFYDGGFYESAGAQLERVRIMLDEGATLIDVGAMSTRPGAPEVSAKEESARLLPVIRRLVEAFPGIRLSVDTYRASVAEKAVKAGAMMVNDISGGSFDPGMIPFIASSQIPYVLMHTQGMPRSMQDAPHYEDVVTEVMQFFGRQLDALFSRGAVDVVLDPGFGFGKNIDHNYALLRGLPEISGLGLPVMVGISRKSMIYQTISTTPSMALNGTTAAHMLALMQGASILRVHDVREATECIRIFRRFQSNS
ncbi:MAG: dihydropteroate synthase [Bacteroidales bacterium]|nr:dihydropteroate synthase [Bacteroidales bacterium]